MPSVLVAFVAQRMRLAQIMRDEQSRLHDIEAARHSAALEALQRQEAFRRAFLRLVAHELRTPMTPVLMDIQTQGGKLPERLTRNLHRLNKVIADVIDITHYESSPSVASQNVDVAALQFPFTTKFTGPVQVQAHAEDLRKAVARLNDVAFAITENGGVTADIEEGQLEITWSLTNPRLALPHAMALFDASRIADVEHGDLRLRVEAARAYASQQGGSLGIRAGQGSLAIWLRLPRSRQGT